jgi:hypothetical protein
MKRISNIDRRNSELDATNTELNILAESDQVYDVEYDTSKNTEDEILSEAKFDFASGNFVIKLGDRSLGMLAHELKHAYQFETGALSTSSYPNGSPFYDQSDEWEAYQRGTLFGSRGIYSLPSRYNNIQKGPVDATNHPDIMYILSMPAELQRIVNLSKRKMAFRINGVTYRTQ